MNILLLGWHKNKQNSFVLKIHTLQCSLISEPQAVLNSKLNLNKGNTIWILKLRIGYQLPVG